MLKICLLLRTDIKKELTWCEDLSKTIKNNCNNKGDYLKWNPMKIEIS